MNQILLFLFLEFLAKGMLVDQFLALTPQNKNNLYGSTFLT